MVTALATTACKNARESDQPSAAEQIERAQEESKQAYERAKEAQQKAIDEQKEAQARATRRRHSQQKQHELAAPSGPRSLAHGPLDEASVDEIVIQREWTEPLHVKLDANTKVEKSDAAANNSDLAKGDRVTVTYRLVGLDDQPVAESVHVIQ